MHQKSTIEINAGVTFVIKSCKSEGSAITKALVCSLEKDVPGYPLMSNVVLYKIEQVIHSNPRRLHPISMVCTFLVPW